MAVVMFTENPVMSNIKKWSYIHKTYNECSRTSILKSFYRCNEFKKNYPYWMFIGLYLLVSIVSLVLAWNEKPYFFVSIFAIAGTALLIQYLLEKRLKKDLKKYYEPNGISEFSPLLKARYLSYVMFKEKLEEEKKIKGSDIESLIAWDEISNEKIDKTVFFKSKWFVMVISAVIGLIVQYFLGLKIDDRGLLIILLLLFIVLWLAFLVFNFTTIPKERHLNIIRFLKWFQIDSKET